MFCLASLQSRGQVLSHQDSLKQKNTQYELRKQERERIRDSIQAESEKAAKARKAYRKSLKKKKKKKVKKKKKDIQIFSPNKKTDPKKVDSTAVKTISSNKKKARTKKDKSKKINIYKDDYVSQNNRIIERIREPPEKKKNYFAFQFGHSNYLGELGGNSALENNLLGDLDFKENTFFYGFSFSQLRKEVVGIRLSYVFGKIAGSDKNTYFQNSSDPSYSRFVRNLDFQTTINEGSLMFEVFPFKFFSYKKKLHHSFFQPYGLIGIGRYSFNPQGSFFDADIDNTTWIDLQPLSLEGQGMSEFPDREVYKLSQWNIPFGFGFNYEISPTISLGLEYVGRALFTDYLDDASTTFIDPTLFDNYLNEDNAILAKHLNNKSKLADPSRAYSAGQQRGNPENNDFYFSVSARLIIKISKTKRKTNLNKIYKYDDNEICE